MILRLTACPEPGCTAPAEILDRRRLTSTDGGVEHLRIQCLYGHHFLLPAYMVPAELEPAPTVVTDRRRGAS